MWSFLQVYAPISGQDRSFHRTLFLFCCKTPECYSHNDSRCLKGVCCYYNVSILSFLTLSAFNKSALLTEFLFMSLLVYSVPFQAFFCEWFLLHISFQKSATQEEWVLPLRPSSRFVWKILWVFMVYLGNHIEKLGPFLHVLEWKWAVLIAFRMLSHSTDISPLPSNPSRL